MIHLHLNDAIIKSLTDNELDILKFIYGNPDQIPDMSIHKFAKAVSYSTATILRFCKKLGYSGFAELKYTIRQHLSERSLTSQNGKKYSLDINQILDILSANMEGTARLEIGRAHV